MKKIGSGKKSEDKKKWSVLLMGLFLAIVIVLGIVGRSFLTNLGGNNRNRKVTYNGVEFKLENGLWYFVIDNKQFATINNPNQTKEVRVEMDKKLDSYKDRPVYFSKNSSNRGIFEVERNLNRYFLRSQKACLSNCTGNYPQKSCEDNVIIIKETNRSEVRQERNCIYIRSNDLKGVDAFIYRLLGLTKPKVNVEEILNNGEEKEV